MKKFLVTLLALLLVLSFTLLAACAPKQGGEGEPTGSESAGPAESGKETDPEPEPAKRSESQLSSPAPFRIWVGIKAATKA